MGAKRKAETPSKARPDKKIRSFPGKDVKPTRTTLAFEPRSDWHAVELPAIRLQDVKTTPPRHAIDNLHDHATTLLEKENAAYNASHTSGSSSHKFLSTIMSSGTLEDKISALTLLVQESPLHTMRAFDNLLALSKKKSRNQALLALAALKDLLGQGVLLPARKLRSFGKQPAVLVALQGKGAQWSEGSSLPGGIEKIHLLAWAFEDWLKRKYFELVQILETWCNDEVEFARSRAITYVWELLKDKPEQEENLLRLLVNKLGDSDRKIASRASYLLLQLMNAHPAMKLVVLNSIESDCLYRPGQSLHARYYAIITLNQTILSQKEDAVANRLLEVYFGLFIQFLKPVEKRNSTAGPKANQRQQGGGGKAGKLARKKQKAEERSDDAEIQLREKLVAQVLTGVNRAFPFADTNNPAFEKQMDMIFRVTHSTNFNTSVQALMLIQQITSTKHYGAERFYRTLYESLLDPRLLTSSKQIMYLNLLYRSLKADLNAKRVQAFVKRLLQTLSLHEPPFACGVLHLISELEPTFPSIHNMMTDPEIHDEDEEEHFVDVPEDHDEIPIVTRPALSSGPQYDPRKRDPEHAHAERSCLWELLSFLRHYHPSVSLFAQSILYQTAKPAQPDPTQHTLIHFLDRFVYRNAKANANGTHGSSIMQPIGGSNAAALLVKPGGGAGKNALPVNSENFWAKKVEDVAADEVFFHAYFNQAGNKKRKGVEKKNKKGKEDEDDDFDAGDNDDDDDADEDEIWQAIAKSRPDVEGMDDSDDDLSLGDLESAYSDSGVEDGSEPGIDLGGNDEADAMPIEVGNGDKEDLWSDGIPDLESGDEDAFFDDDDNLPFDVDDLGDDDDEADEEAEPTLGARQKKKNRAADEAEAKSGKKRKNADRKKFKHLPTFASAEDYAQLLDAEPDDM